MTSEPQAQARAVPRADGSRRWMSPAVMAKDERMRKSASSPTPPVVVESRWIRSLMSTTITAWAGPIINEVSSTGRPLRSNLRKGGNGGKVNSKNITTVEMAAIIAVTVRRRVRLVDLGCCTTAFIVCCSFRFGRSLRGV